jgi:hypothetical protein
MKRPRRQPKRRGAALPPGTLERLRKVKANERKEGKRGA